MVLVHKLVNELLIHFMLMTPYMLVYLQILNAQVHEFSCLVSIFFFLSTNLLDTCIENSLAPSTLKQGSLQNCLFAGAVFILKRDLFFSK